MARDAHEAEHDFDHEYLAGALVILDGEDVEVIERPPVDDYPDWVRSRIPRPGGVRGHTERGPNV